MLNSFRYSFGSAIDVEFMVDILKMPFHGVDADIAGMTDHFIGVAFYQQLQYFLFAGGKIVLVINDLFLPEILKYFLRHEGAHRRSAFHYFFKALYQL